MEWEARWDFDFSSFTKAPESPRKLPLLDVSDDTGSFFCFSMEPNMNSASPTMLSNESLSTDVIHDSSLMIMAAEGSLREPCMEVWTKEAELCGASLLGDASVDELEPLVGLKLRKRTYLDDSDTWFSTKVSKSSRTESQSRRTPQCIIEECNVDLSSAKGYHRKHRVCEFHSKCFKVTVEGVDSRFCQQCSRFHSLSEFDDKKRSCRQRLSDHNARRRKLQLHNFPATFSSSFNDGEDTRFHLINGLNRYSREFGSSGFSNPNIRITRGTNPYFNSAQTEVVPKHFGVCSLLSPNYWGSAVESYRCIASEPMVMHHEVDQNFPPSSYGELLQQHSRISTPCDFDSYANMLN